MAGPQRAKVYRNVELRQQWLGLEPFDALALGFLLWLLMLLDRQALGWNLLLVVIGYVALRIGKRGKPSGLTTAFIKFYLLRKPFFSAGAPDADAAANPFPFAASLHPGASTRKGDAR